MSADMFLISIAGWSTLLTLGWMVIVMISYAVEMSKVLRHKTPI